MARRGSYMPNQQKATSQGLPAKERESRINQTVKAAAHLSPQTLYIFRGWQQSRRSYSKKISLLSAQGFTIREGEH